MPVGRELLEVLCCPVSRSSLRAMTPDEVEEFNTTITEGRARFANGAPLTETLECGLVTVDEASVYAIREGVPALMPELRMVCDGGAAPVMRANPAGTREEPWADYWENVSRHWDDLRPPRRPAPQDIALFERLVAEGFARAHSARPRALLLGVTPEIATMHWPAGTQLLALDGSAAMIRHVWPRRALPDAAAVRGSWSAMPIRDAACDIVVGDSSVAHQPYPDTFFAVVGEVGRVLKDGGVLVTRAFTRPEEREPVEAIFDDLRNGRIGTLDFCRWRLAAALHGDRATGTRMGDIWDVWEANVPDPRGLMRSLGWPEEAARAMENLRGGEAVLIFPTLSELRDGLVQDLDEMECEFPDYEDGDRYPILMLRRKPRSGRRSRT